MQIMKSADVLSALTSRTGAIAGTAALIALGLVTGFTATAQSTEQTSAGTATSQVFTPEQRQSIEQIVKDYLLQHPEVMVDVGKELERRQTAMQADEHKRFIGEKRATIFASSSDFVLGNPKADVTVVEFFDYNCAWCKKAVDELTKLTKAEPNIRVVFKEFPIFGEASTLAAKAAMASIKQGKYWDFHQALMKEKQVTKESLFKVAEKVGLDVTRLKADMNDPSYEAAIKSTTELAQGLGIEGTPGFIVDAKVNVGYVPADGLQQMIAEIRKSGCQVC